MLINAEIKEPSMPRIILLTALAAMCFTACRASGDVANSRPTPTTNVAANKENAAPGRWARLTVKNNHGSTEYTELMDFRATGKQLTKTPLPDASGTYDSSYGKFHIHQQGTSVTGCYESGSGLIDGGVEGRVLTFTWREASRRYGPAIMVFSPDGKLMTGVWWDHNDVNRAGGLWDGTGRALKLAPAVTGRAGSKNSSPKISKSSGGRESTA